MSWIISLITFLIGVGIGLTFAFEALDDKMKTFEARLRFTEVAMNELNNRLIDQQLQKDE